MKLAGILMTAAFTLCAAAVILTVTVNNDTGAPKEADAAPTAAASEQPAARTLTITAVGDCTFGTDENFDPATSFNAYAEQYGFDWFFGNVRDIFAEDDLTIVNFEGTLTDRGEREAKQFAFRADPSYVDILTGSSVEAANLANNHSSDYGTVSLEDTVKHLTDAGILTCRGKDNVTVTEINGIKVGLVGINYLNDQMRTELEAALQSAEEQGAEITILSMHWGVEKATEPNEDQIEAAHRAIDLGADLVIGTHPHVLEGVEKYNGRYILYSLGNFSFGGNSSPSDTDTAIFRQTFTLTADGLADDDNYELIPCSITSADGYNDYRPTPAQGSQRERIIEKLTDYSAALGTDSLNFR